ncbi:hypothetical protein [Limnohabitans sp.]|uniref:hypothetical protein n=1 Tax=Limnohabitans sp. TaxID=1907725 RepID=UPI0039BC8416|nr:MarR family winged helix-turn-helix transcriptional regulator [Comamonadaceae bacterium]
MTFSPVAEPYLHFLMSLSAPENFHEHGAFDANHKALFESAVLHWFLGKPLSVLETISQAELGSPATLHKRLQALIAQDLVKSECMGTDKRTKYVSPSTKGIRYLDWVGDKMFKALPLSE